MSKKWTPKKSKKTMSKKWVHICLYTFIYLHVPLYTPEYLYIPSYTPIYIKIYNIRKMRSDIRPENSGSCRRGSDRRGSRKTWKRKPNGARTGGLGQVGQCLCKFTIRRHCAMYCFYSSATLNSFFSCSSTIGRRTPTSVAMLIFS